MLSYFLKCWKKKESKNPKVANKTKANGQFLIRDGWDLWKNKKLMDY